MDHFEPDNEGPPARNASLNEQSWAMAIHLSALVGLWAPGLNVLAPLALWFYKRAESPALNREGIEAVNAQLSYTLYMALTVPFCFILIGLPILAALMIFDIVVVIMKAVAINNGKPFTYPFVIRFLKS